MKCKIPKLSRPLFYLITGIALVVLIFCLGAYFAVSSAKKQAEEAEIFTVSTLQKVINTSELSTYTAVYNGIAQVMNENNPEETDYYVAYEAKVNAGIDFQEIEITSDSDTNTIYVTLPEVYITDVNVDVSSLDFLFYNDKANTSTVSAQALKACEADVRAESEQQESIFLLAKQNAENVINALASPILEQSDIPYTLHFE